MIAARTLRKVAFGLLALACSSSPPAAPVSRAQVVEPPPKAPVLESRRLRYPPSPRGSVVELLHGVSVRDPYRWLEDSSASETQAWMLAQNRLTRSYLAQLPRRDAIRARLRELWDFERFELPVERGGRYFYHYNSGLQNQASLYWLKSLDAEPQLLLDPNLLSEDGTVALTHAVPTEDGKLVAYGLSRAGSDWTEWRVRRVDDGQDLPDLLQWSKFSSVAWLKDRSGFYYSAYDPPQPGAVLSATNYFNKLYFHKLGQKQSADALVYERRDKSRWSFAATTTRDGRYVVITAEEGTDPKNAVLYLDLTRPKAPPAPLVPNIEAAYGFIGNRGSTFWFHTDRDAPRGRVMSVDVSKPKPSFVEVVPEQAETLRQVERVGGKFLANYLEDAHAAVRIFTDRGALERAVPLPGLGTVWLAEGDDSRSETFLSLESFHDPRRLLRYDVAKNSSEVFRKPHLKFDADAYETQQVFFASKDGTRIPMFVSYKKGIVPGPDTPCLLYGYGGFDISITPTFGAGNLAWLELGGLLAVPNLRGGGEYGEKWHEAGKKALKQNVFDDFIAAAEYLLRERLTSRAKLGIAGRSNGGLLIGAMLAQRPELFGAALPGVGVMDMLRFHKFTIGWTWTDDYGSPDDPEDFKVLYAYSPLHNLRVGVKYPATLITTADHDDRVVPAHSFKFAAALQYVQAGDAPILIRIETRAGHGAGIPTDKRIDEIADQWAFLLAELARP
jgi:prolyl oligopeptidase